MEGNSHIDIDRSRSRLSSIIIMGQSEMLPTYALLNQMHLCWSATSESTSGLSISSALA